MMRGFRMCVLLTVALLGVGGLALTLLAHGGVAGPRGKHTAGTPASAVNRGRLTDALLGDLRRGGFEVTQGYPKLWTQQDCDRYGYPIMRNCYANNPAAPYVLAVVKSWKDEFVDPATVNAYGKTRRGYSVTHRFDPREAVVVFGKMPPPGRYMGLQSYVFTTEWLTDDLPWSPSAHAQIEAQAPQLIKYLFGTVPRDPSRVESFSSLSNSINNVVMQRRSGDPFGQTRYFVVTPDRDMDAAVRRSLARLGVQMKDVFTEPIPPSHPLGMGRGADDFLTGIRYAVPDPGYEQAATAWRNNPPLSVLRVRVSPSSHRPQKPFPGFVADQRAGRPEGGYAPDLNNLVRQVCQRWRQPCNPDNPDPNQLSRLVDLQLDVGQFGPQCRAVGMDCLGDGQDASYFIAPGHPLDPGWVYAVIGTLATKTGNATYVGLSINDLSKLKGVLNIPDTQLAGSAASYARTVANTDKFFVQYFTRDCTAIRALTNGQCTSVTKQMVPPPRKGNSTSGLFSAAVRSYVFPGSERGPLSSDQLKPMIIRFAHP
jgi:hypothetical protein